MPTIKGFRVNNQNMLYYDPNIAEEFNPEQTYDIGDFVIHPDNGKLYVFTKVHQAGDWVSTDVRETKVVDNYSNSEDITELKKAIGTNTGIIQDSIITFDTNTITSLKNLIINIKPTQTGSGDVKPDNRRPLIGYNNCNIIKISGKNLFYEDRASWTSNHYIDINGIIKSSNAWKYTDTYLPIQPNQTYTIQLEKEANSYVLTAINIIFYDINKKFIIRQELIKGNLTGNLNTTFSTPQDAAFYRLTLAKTGISNIQLELGPIASSYEICQGKIYSISLLNTIFDGTLDIAERKVTNKYAITTINQLNWNYNSSTQQFYASKSNLKPGAVRTSLIYCDRYRCLYNKEKFDKNYEDVIYTGDQYIYIQDHNYNNVNDFKGAMGDTQIIYPLNSPISSLISIPEEFTISANDIIWTDCGDVTAVYYKTLENALLNIDEINTNIDKINTDIDNINNTMTKTTTNICSEVQIYQKTILSSSNGGTATNDLWWTTNFIQIDKDAIAYFFNKKFVINEYSENSTSSWIDHGYSSIQTDGSLFKLNPETNYIRLSFQNINSPEEVAVLPVYDSQFFSIAEQINKLSKPPLTWGRENVLARARHFLDIEWTPVAPFPLCTGSYKYRIVPAGEKQVGLPYSSTRNVAKLIGVNISIYTFMTALANPRSVLYTRKITTGYVGASYYGQHCASFVAYANGDKGCAIDSLSMASIYCKEISKYELQPGDLLIRAQDRSKDFALSQHCLLVYDIHKDKYGRIDTVQIVEGNFPYVRYNAWKTFGQGIEENLLNGYKCYRGNTVEATPYTASEFVKGYADETLPEFIYPDIMPEYGDKACVEAGTEVTINVINPKTYTRIEIYKDDDPPKTRSEIKDFKITVEEPGKYRFVLTDGNNTSESSLIAVEVGGTYDSSTGIVTFSCSDNATPIAMQSYADESSKAGYSGVHNIEHLFTPEEISNHQANASDITNNYFPNVQVSFMSEYGTAVWSSKPLSDQWVDWNPDVLQILEQPLNASVEAGNTLTMSVKVNKPDEAKYQWQYYYNNRWNNFLNSNDKTLTRDNVSSGWNNWHIRCIVTSKTNQSINIISRSAILRVY